MRMRSDPAAKPVPLDGLVFGYGPMLPLVAAAVGAWALPPPWPALAVRLSIVWGAMILVFIGGVRRGFGFGEARASTVAEIVTMLAYFTIGGVALVLTDAWASLLLLALGFPLAALGDSWAARVGDAPRFFARLRPPQLAIGTIALVAILARLA